jgi:hypothetical protein
MMQRCNHLHGKKGVLDEVKVLAPQQTTHVMEDNREVETGGGHGWALRPLL